jgi:hypothetical protein
VSTGSSMGLDGNNGQDEIHFALGRNLTKPPQKLRGMTLNIRYATSATAKTISHPTCSMETIAQWHVSLPLAVQL